MEKKRTKHGPKYSSKNICAFCGYIAAYSFNLKEHIMRRHTNEKPFKCEECPLRFVQNSELTRHKRNRHTKELLYKCEVCEERFKSLVLKNMHEDREHDIEVHCKLCNAVFYKKIDLRHHKRTVHGSEQMIKNAFSCDTCFRVFSSNEQLTRHKVQHKSHVCVICHLKLATSLDLRSHKRSVHNVNTIKRNRFAKVEVNSILTMKDKNTFECNLCHSYFYRRTDFFSHVESDHPELMDKVCPYVCKFCSKKFAARQNLSNHMLIHKNNRKFQCDLCDYSSIRGGDLRKHKRVIHSINKLECKLCDKKFRQYKTLNNHVNIHLGKKDFRCNICGLEFYAKEKFLNHLAAHKNADDDHHRYLCPTCGLKLKSSASLQSHLKRHKDSAMVSSFPKLLADKLVKIVKPESMLMESNENQSETHCCNETFPGLIYLFRHSYYHHNPIYECFACGECLASDDLCKHLNSHEIVIE